MELLVNLRIQFHIFFFLSHKAKVTIDPCRFNGTVSVLKVNDVRLMFHSNLIGEMILLTLKM